MPSDMTIERAVEVVKDAIKGMEAGMDHTDCDSEIHAVFEQRVDALTTLLANRAALEAEVGRLRGLLRTAEKDYSDAAKQLSVEDGIPSVDRATRLAHLYQRWNAIRDALAGEVEGGTEQQEGSGK